jgi:hypothetical protein
MRNEDREAIDGLFERLRQVEAGAGRREPEAEAHICKAVGLQPLAPYYMAQTIVAQAAALADAEQRIAELETRAQPARGGLLSGLFGSEPGTAAPDPGQTGSGRAPPRSDGFLASAAETAFAVAGGVILANVVADSLFGAGVAPGTEDGIADGETAIDSGGDIDSGDFNNGL